MHWGWVWLLNSAGGGWGGVGREGKGQFCWKGWATCGRAAAQTHTQPSHYQRSDRHSLSQTSIKHCKTINHSISQLHHSSEVKQIHLSGLLIGLCGNLSNKGASWTYMRRTYLIKPPSIDWLGAVGVKADHVVHADKLMLWELMGCNLFNSIKLKLNLNYRKFRIDQLALTHEKNSNKSYIWVIFRGCLNGHTGIQRFVSPHSSPRYLISRFWKLSVSAMKVKVYQAHSGDAIGCCWQYTGIWQCGIRLGCNSKLGGQADKYLAIYFVRGNNWMLLRVMGGKTPEH